MCFLHQTYHLNQLQRLVQIRMGTVGVVCAGDLMKGDKTRELGGYKLLYNGADESGRNGVRIVLSRELIKDSLVSVSRRNDQVMGFPAGHR